MTWLKLASQISIFALKPNQISFQVKFSSKFCLFVTPSQPSGSNSEIYSFGRLFNSMPLSRRAPWHCNTPLYPPGHFLPRLFCWGSFPAVSSLPAPCSLLQDCCSLQLIPTAKSYHTRYLLNLWQGSQGKLCICQYFVNSEMIQT